MDHVSALIEEVSIFSLALVRTTQRSCTDKGWCSCDTGGKGAASTSRTSRPRMATLREPSAMDSLVLATTSACKRAIH